MGSLSRELLEEIVALSTESLLIVDASGPEIAIVHANRAYETRSGYSAAELVGSSWLECAAVEPDAPELIELRQNLVSKQSVEVCLPFLRKDGELWLARLCLQPLSAAGKDRQLWLVQHQGRETNTSDGAELLKRALSRARHRLANPDRIDPVTSLTSRAELELMLRRELAAARREGGSISLLLFAIPELEVYRQTFGDNAADSCLRMIGAQLSGTFRRATDLCARFDRSMLAAAIRGQDEAQARELVALVETKARNLGLHNPRGRIGRMIFVRGAVVQAEPAHEDVDGLFARALTALEAGATSQSAPTAESVGS